MIITKWQDLNSVEIIYNLMHNISLEVEEAIIDLVDSHFYEYDDMVNILLKEKKIDLKDLTKIEKSKFKNYKGKYYLNLFDLLTDYFDEKDIDYNGEYLDEIYAYFLSLIIIQFPKYKQLLYKETLEIDSKGVFNIKSLLIPDYVKNFKLEY